MPGVHTPATHESEIVHALPSSQTEPSRAATFAHWKLVDALQRSVVHGLWSSQVDGHWPAPPAPPMMPPAPAAPPAPPRPPVAVPPPDPLAPPVPVGHSDENRVAVVTLDPRTQDTALELLKVI